MMKQLVFNIGDMRQSHNITILNDTVCERTPNERFFSNLTYISGDGPINITPMTAEIVINDFAEKECGKRILSNISKNNNHKLYT